MENFDIEKYQKETSEDYKLIYDVFCAYFLHIMEGKDKQKHASMLSADQVKKTNDWLIEQITPFYEELEEYEKCARIKAVVKFLKEEKDL